MGQVAKAILDLSELLALVGKGVSRAKPWERQLTTDLVDLDRRLQVLRMTIAMERDDSEILSAAEAVLAGCREAASALRGSRASATVQAALRLATDLGGSIVATLRQLVRENPGQTASTA